MSNSTELELTYLAKEVPKELESIKPQKLVDIYVPEESDFPVVRLRRKGDDYEITKKTPLKAGDYSGHLEETIPLNQTEFEALRKASNRSVTKDRYRVSIEDHEAEVDVFGGKLEGLIMIDFEFENINEKQSFSMPRCCLADVTQERFALGGQLAGKNYKDIQKDLERFGYKRLERT